MAIDFHKLFAAGAFAFALTLGTAHAQDEFGAYDADSNGSLSETEFQDGVVSGGIGDWDGNSDGMLDENEFSTGLYENYDEDSDGLLSEDEYAAFEEDGWFE